MLGFELHVLARREVLGDVGARSEEPLLFTTPERQTYAAIEPQIERLQDAHHLDHDRAPSGVIGRTGAAVPAVQMRADHHYSVALPASRNFRDDIDRVGAIVEETRVDIESELDRDLVVQ